MPLITYWKKAVLENYVTFSGRSNRPEFWWFILAVILVNLALSPIPIISNIWGIGMLLPQFAASFRRLHDTGRSGWWLLLWLVPIVGWIILIVWHASSGDGGPNKYGSPSGAPAAPSDSPLPPPPPPPV